VPSAGGPSFLSLYSSLHLSTCMWALLPCIFSASVRALPICVCLCALSPIETMRRERLCRVPLVQAISRFTINACQLPVIYL